MPGKFGSKTRAWLAASNESFNDGSILLVLLHPYLSVSKVPITQPRERERERVLSMPRDFSILLILETGSRELIGGIMGWGGGGQRLSGENRVGGGIE